MKNLGYLNIHSPGRADTLRYLPITTAQDELSDFDFYANKHTEDEFIEGFDTKSELPLFLSQTREMQGFIPLDMDLTDNEVLDFFFKDGGKIRKQYALQLEVLIATDKGSKPPKTRREKYTQNRNS